ncbi:hypothetical protein [Salinibacterium sp. TMP30]|uniref:hypothetical protein n=1 Tax=Salinibacterium sp. TMP30 TaxID=3138237 RepID=UPI0031394B6E
MFSTIWSHLWSHIRPVTAPQRFLFVVGAILLVSALIHSGIALGALASGQEWSGPISWRKPVVFAGSFGMLSLTAAWILRLLPTTRWTWIPALMLGVFSFTEVSAITIQKWRGVPSHFNEATSFDVAMFGIMAVSVLTVVLALAILLVWVVLRFRGNGGERIAAIVGLVSLIAAGYIGNQMIDVGTAQTVATGSVPYEVVFGADGSAKLSHFVGMHLIQFLAVLAIFASARRRVAAVALGSVGGLAVFGSVTLTAYAGQPWITPDLATGALGILGVVVAVVALALTARSFTRQEGVTGSRTPAPVG